MTSNKHVDFRKIESSGTAVFKKHLFFLNKKSNAFEVKLPKFWAKQTTVFFLIENKF